MITIKTEDGNVEVDERNIYFLAPLMYIPDKAYSLVLLANHYDIISVQHTYKLKSLLEEKGLYCKETICDMGRCFKVGIKPFLTYEERNVPHGTMESESRVEHPNYYKLSNGIEVLDIVRDLPFNIGNVVKYVIRAGRKKEAGLSDKQKQIEDLEKAKFYIEDAIKQLNKEE